MVAMTTTRTEIAAGPWTVDDLDGFPDGTTRRYELIDGALLVSAEPSLQHQRVAAALYRLLHDAAPDDFEVVLPIDVRLSPTRQVAPDISVVRRSDAGGNRLLGVPLLVVEVQSPAHGRSISLSSDVCSRRRACRPTGSRTPTRAP